MANVFITGSADGLGHLAAKALLQDGHSVVLHARHAERGQDALKKLPEATSVVTGDLSDLQATLDVADQVNALGAFDVVIHNAGVYQVPANQIFAVNTIAPYVLTCLIQKPKRLIYLSSGMQQQGRFSFENFDKGRVSYSDSKLHVLMLAKALARRWPGVYANAVDPGWVPTRMGGKGAPDDLQKGFETQVWLAVSNDEKAAVSGRYFFHLKERSYNRLADDESAQDKLVALCGQLSGVALPL